MSTNRSKSDQFLLRFPPGLRERVKWYADQKGRSLNEQIIRLLEREFPEPQTFEATIANIRGMIRMLEKGFDQGSVGVLENELREALRGISAGRIYDFPDAAYEDISKAIEAWDEAVRENEQDDVHMDMDDEELDNLAETGSTAKIVFVGEPLPKRRRLGNLSEEEFEAYKLGYEAGIAARHEPVSHDDPFADDDK